MLSEGDKAPVFSGTDQDGNKIALEDFLGKKLVLYFYPQDMTETCTIQACNLRDNFSSLKKKGISILGISPDTVASHKKFETRYDLPYPLISDAGHKIIDAYGVWGEKQLFGRKYMGLLRTTFLINEKGKIVKVIERPKSKEHSKEILTAWKMVI